MSLEAVRVNLPKEENICRPSIRSPEAQSPLWQFDTVFRGAGILVFVGPLVLALEDRGLGSRRYGLNVATEGVASEIVQGAPRLKALCKQSMCLTLHSLYFIHFQSV